jgi:class 3 adenylate cyclase
MRGIEHEDRSGIRVLFVDIVGFTKRSKKQQISAVLLLTQAVLGSLDILRQGRQKKKKQIDQADAAAVYLASTGDGYVVALYDHSLRHGVLLDLACTIQARLRRSDRSLELRYGLNVGPGVLVMEDRKVTNVLGSCINMAHRVMSLGDGNHILMTDAAKDEVEPRDVNLNTYFDVRLEKGNSSRSTVYSYYNEKVGNARAPYRILMGHLNIEHATEEILDMMCERVTKVISEFVSERKHRKRIADPRVRATILNLDRRQGLVWVTPHSRCNGKTVRVTEHEFTMSKEGLFSTVANSNPNTPSIEFILGLPDPKRDPRGYVRALCQRGRFKRATVSRFSKRPRSFIYFPIIHRDSVVGILSFDAISPICEDKSEFQNFGDLLRHCFDSNLMRILGHCYQD